jgi:hypothetical protein
MSSWGNITGCSNINIFFLSTSQENKKRKTVEVETSDVFQRIFPNSPNGGEINIPTTSNHGIESKKIKIDETTRFNFSDFKNFIENKEFDKAFEIAEIIARTPSTSSPSSKPEKFELLVKITQAFLELGVFDHALDLVKIIASSPSEPGKFETLVKITQSSIKLAAFDYALDVVKIIANLLASESFSGWNEELKKISDAFTKNEQYDKTLEVAKLITKIPHSEREKFAILETISDAFTENEEFDKTLEVAKLITQLPGSEQRKFQILKTIAEEDFIENEEFDKTLEIAKMIAQLPAPDSFYKEKFKILTRLAKTLIGTFPLEFDKAFEIVKIIAKFQSSSHELEQLKALAKIAQAYTRLEAFKYVDDLAKIIKQTSSKKTTSDESIAISSLRLNVQFD